MNDFFKNRLKNWEAKDDDWAKPDAAVKTHVLQQIQITNQPKESRKKPLFIIFLLMTLLTVGETLTYVWQQNKFLKTKQKIQATELAKANKIIKKLKSTTIKNRLSPIVETINEKPETINKTNGKIEVSSNLYNKYRANNATINHLKNIIEQQNKTILQLKNENQALSKEVVEKVEIIALLENDKNKLVVNQNAKNQSINLLQNKEYVAINSNLNNWKISTKNLISDNNLSKRNNKKSRFEIGYELSLVGIKTQYETSYKDFTKTSQKNEIKEQLTLSNGLRMAYVLNENWSIQTGFRYGQSTWETDLEFSSIYDKSEEYIKPNGNIGNDLTLKSSGILSETESQISVEIPNATDLNNGDLIVSDLISTETITSLQIPIGVEYYFGESRLNYSLQSGININQITSKNYTIDGNIQSYNSELKIENIEYKNEDYTKRYFEGYFGISLRYDLTPKLAIHANYNYRLSPYFLKNLTMTNRSLQLGLNYSL